MKIALINVRYSPNLGDGIIADCIEHYLRQNIDSLQVCTVDIGGMEDYTRGGSIFGPRLSLMSKVRQLPSLLRTFTISHLVPIAVRLKYGRRWHEQLHDCDAMIVGGGHLIMDVDHYFPMRIREAVKQSRRHTPLCVYAVGVSKKMTRTGIAMFSDALQHAHVCDVSVRDQNSLVNWVSHFGTPAPRVSPDPALLSYEVYATAPFAGDPQSRAATVALCVSDPASMLPHADGAKGVVCGDLAFYIQAIQLLATDYQVNVFTNGEDDPFLQYVAGEVSALPHEIRDKVSILPRPILPEQLVAQIAAADVVVAHRLHANIVAFSLGIPHIGLGWDDKLNSFFTKIDRAQYLVLTNDGAPFAVKALVDRALREGIDPKVHSRTVQEARNGLDTLVSALKLQVGP